MKSHRFPTLTTAPMHSSTINYLALSVTYTLPLQEDTNTKKQTKQEARAREIKLAENIMKRQGDDILGIESERKGKKTAAAVVAEEKRCKEEKEVVVVVGHGGDNGGLPEEEEEEEIWEEWLWRGGEDEEMWWGTCWDVGIIMGGEAYNELFNDVLWEDDVWDLKQIKDVPVPVPVPVPIPIPIPMVGDQA